MLIPGRPFDLERHPFLLDLYNCIAQEVVVYKASQMGASEYLISYELHACDQRDATALHVFPTDKHVSDFSSARIGPAIEASPYLQQVVVSGGAAGEVKGADRVTLKRIRDRYLYLRGAKVDPRGMANQLKSIDADVLAIDELDEMDPRAPLIAEKRLGASAIAEIRRVSTPTYTGYGVHAEWMLSDQREWYVRCIGCGERQPMTIHQVITEWDELGRPVRWHGMDEGRAWVACRKCGKELNRLAFGEWVATRPEVEVAGFHMTKLFSPSCRLQDVVLTLQTVDETKRKEAVNQDLGEPYTPKGGGLTDEVIDACRREYAHKIIEKEETYLGCDVGRVLHVVIRGQPDPATGARPQRWAGIVESWDELGRMMNRYNEGARAAGGAYAEDLPGVLHPAKGRIEEAGTGGSGSPGRCGQCRSDTSDG
jgi:phage terminase large subunit GpA-like protein